MLGVQAGRAEEYSRKTFELEQKRHHDNQLLNSLTEQEKERVRNLISKFDMNIWFEKMKPRLDQDRESLKQNREHGYRFEPKNFGLKGLNYNESFVFCYFLLPKIKRFFKDKPGYSISTTLDDENRIVLMVQGTIPLKWYERIIYCF